LDQNNLIDRKPGIEGSALRSQGHLIHCPKCLGHLRPRGDRNLECSTHGQFEIESGIPRLTPGTLEFDKHWNDNNSEALPHSKLVRAKKFLQHAFREPGGSFAVLDAGCGDGVHQTAISENAPWARQAQKYGVDLSMSALRAAKSRSAKDWNFICSDIAELPFKDETFDIVYSYGVIAYTEDPRHCFGELCRVVKAGGLVGVWFYPKSEDLVSQVFRFVRWLCQVTAPIGPRLIADLMVPIIGFVPTSSGISLKNATWKQCRELILVNIAPSRFYFPQPQELQKWFADEGFDLELQDAENPLTYWGRKRSK
jgi:ubiquinone/menaquinone biosynthesis C-methylase UbiE